MWPGFKSRRRHYMWVEFVVGSLPGYERFFPGYSCFPLSSRTNISKLQFDQKSGIRRTTMWWCYLQITIYLFIDIRECGIHQGRQQLYNCFWTQHTSSHHTKAEVNNCFIIHKKYFLTNIPPRRLSSKLWPISRPSFLFFSSKYYLKSR